MLYRFSDRRFGHARERFELRLLFALTDKQAAGQLSQQSDTADLFFFPFFSARIIERRGDAGVIQRGLRIEDTSGKTAVVVYTKALFPVLFLSQGREIGKREREREVYEMK